MVITKEQKIKKVIDKLEGKDYCIHCGVEIELDYNDEWIHKLPARPYGEGRYGCNYYNKNLTTHAKKRKLNAKIS